MTRIIEVSKHRKTGELQQRPLNRIASAVFIITSRHALDSEMELLTVVKDKTISPDDARGVADRYLEDWYCRKHAVPKYLDVFGESAFVRIMHETETKNAH